MPATFDRSAELYNASIPPLPEEYIRLILTCFHIKKSDIIVDLGCGSGTLALALTPFSSFVQGLDASEVMIKIASSRDIDHRVNWVRSRAEEYDFGCDRYNIIISFEAFHLFSDAPSLIKKCAAALKPGGYLGIGWVNYEWEAVFKDTIIDVFKAYGIGWEDWNYWSCPDFPGQVRDAKSSLSDVVTRSVQVKATTDLSAIASYLISIERASSLGEDERQLLFRELIERFGLITPARWSSGTAYYSLAFCSKLVY